MIDTAFAASDVASGGSLSDIEHVVILMQENRSFDHYFGTLPGVRGFTDAATYRSYPGGPTTTAAQSVRQSMVDGTTVRYRLANGDTTLMPFELVSVASGNRRPVHQRHHPRVGPPAPFVERRGHGRFVRQHLRYGTPSRQLLNSLLLATAPIGVATMGYFRSRDYLAFYRALADAFTICDSYYCSVLGPTDPNRLMWLSGSIGATGTDRNGDPNGGPILQTYVGNRPRSTAP